MCLCGLEEQLYTKESLVMRLCIPVFLRSLCVYFIQQSSVSIQQSSVSIQQSSVSIQQSSVSSEKVGNQG